jgi:NAD(P)-dependent dehydrogenase (short-subunit alcohol dehydrogenase family)
VQLFVFPPTLGHQLLAPLSKVLDMSNVAIITGAGSGFGLGLTKKLLGEDWIVYGADISPDGLALLKSIGAHPLKVNVTSDSQVSAGVKKVIKEQGRIDVLVANAGYGTFSSVEETASEQVRAIFDVNVFGVERFVKAVLPQMRKQGSGRIVATTSVVAHVSLVGLGWYSGTKHAVRAMTNALRQEVRHLGIRVSTVEPGTSKTGFGALAFETLDKSRSISDYDGVMRGLNKWLGGLYRVSPGPKTVINTLHRAATAKRPRAHYPGSWDVVALKLAFYLLPRKTLDALVLWLAKH